MNEIPRQKLREIIAQHGRDIYRQREKCKGFLLDYCSGFRKEVNVLITALEEGTPGELLNSSTGNAPNELLVARLTQRLCDERSLESESARWAVESWVFALGMKIPARSKPTPAEPPKPAKAPQSTTIYLTKPLPPPVPKPTTQLDQSTYTNTSFPNSLIFPTSSLPSSNVRPTPAPPKQQHLPQTPTKVNPPSTTSRLPTRVNPPSTASRPPTRVNPPLTTSRPPSPSRPRSSYYARRRAKRMLASLFLIPFSLFLMMLGTRMFIFHAPQLTLLPFTLYIVGALLGPRRGIFVGLAFLVLGAFGLPFFLGGDVFQGGVSPSWAAAFLYFYPGTGGWIPFALIYYAICPVILFIVGRMCRNDYYDNSFGRSLYIVFIGQVIFTIFDFVIYIFHYNSISSAFHNLNFLQVVYYFILAFIAIIPVYVINTFYE